MSDLHHLGAGKEFVPILDFYGHYTLHLRLVLDLVDHIGWNHIGRQVPLLVMPGPSALLLPSPHTLTSCTALPFFYQPARCTSMVATLQRTRGQRLNLIECSIISQSLHNITECQALCLRIKGIIVIYVAFVRKARDSIPWAPAIWRGSTLTG